MYGDNMNDQGSSDYLMKLKYKDKLWQKKLFSILKAIYNHPKAGVSENTYTKIIFYFSRALLTLQYASLVWEQKVSIAEWSNFNYIWYGINYCRLDIILAEVYLIQNSIILIFSFYSALFLITVLMILLKVIKNAKMPKLVYFLGKLLALTEVLNIPFVVILILVLKYSWLHIDTVEYTVNAHMDYSIVGVLMSLACLAFAISIEICSALFSYDCRHSQAKNSFKNKANSIPDLYCLSGWILSVIMYAFVSTYNFVAYRFLLVALHGIIAWSFFYYLPYYNFYANFAKSLPHVFVFVSGFIMIAGYGVDSSLFCVLSLMILTPLWFYIWHVTLRYRVSKVGISEVRDLKSIWEFELAIRDRLLNYQEDQSEYVSKLFGKFFSSNRCEKKKF
jgi:hypothetical protein